MTFVFLSKFTYPKHFGSEMANRQEVDSAKLREAVQLPNVNFQASIVFSIEEGIVVSVGRFQWINEIAAIEKSLVNNPSDAPAHSRLAILYGKIDDDKRSELARNRAIEIYRRILTSQPEKKRGRPGRPHLI